MEKSKIKGKQMELMQDLKEMLAIRDEDIKFNIRKNIIIKNAGVLYNMANIVEVVHEFNVENKKNDIVFTPDIERKNIVEISYSNTIDFGNGVILKHRNNYWNDYLIYIVDNIENIDDYVIKNDYMIALNRYIITLQKNGKRVKIEELENDNNNLFLDFIIKMYKENKIYEFNDVGDSQYKKLKEMRMSNIIKYLENIV